MDGFDVGVIFKVKFYIVMLCVVWKWGGCFVNKFGVIEFYDFNVIVDVIVGF